LTAESLRHTVHSATHVQNLAGHDRHDGVVPAVPRGGRAGFATLLLSARWWWTSRLPLMVCPSPSLGPDLWASFCIWLIWPMISSSTATCGFDLSSLSHPHVLLAWLLLAAGRTRMLRWRTSKSSVSILLAEVLVRLRYVAGSIPLSLESLYVIVRAITNIRRGGR
jgi:hypothetical protein